MFAWLKALLLPLIGLHSSFKAFTIEKYTDIQTNGQVCKLKAGLNRIFDGVQKRIYIEDGRIVDSIFIYTAPENKPIYLPQFLSSTQGDFVVYIPQTLRPEETRIRAYINKYKLPSKNYSIRWII
jgi:hypothetical protein